VPLARVSSPERFQTDARTIHIVVFPSETAPKTQEDSESEEKTAIPSRGNKLDPGALFPLRKSFIIAQVNRVCPVFPF
jgi:hypothetical protein